MAKMLTLLLLVVVCLTDLKVAAFVVPLELKEKCEKADLIVRAVVIDVVRLTGDPSEGRITSEDYYGPHSVALVRVVEVLKSGEGRREGVILVPCGHDIDESPGELTKAKDYLLFLKSMGHNYFHPVDAYSTHRISAGRVALSGLDDDSAFEADAGEVKTEAYDRYCAHIKGLLAAAKK